MVPKREKSANSGQNHKVVSVLKQGDTGTTIQNPIGTDTSGTDTTMQKVFGTGTTMQKVFGTGTKQSGTGTTVSKCSDFDNFA